MDPEPSAPERARRVSLARAMAGGLLVVLLMAGALGYHDGAYDVDPVASADEAGPYRFRGVVESWDARGESFLLRDESGTLVLHWNATAPDVGRRYVVNARVSENGTVEAEALSSVLLIHSRWF